MNGLTTKYDLPVNFLERCIQTKLKKKLSTEEVSDFDFIDLKDDIGERLREPREAWSKGIDKSDVRKVRPKITERLKDLNIDVRDKQLWRPLIEYAYFCGDDVYDMAIAAAKGYLEKPETKQTIREELLDDILENCLDKKVHFFYSDELCHYLKEMLDRPWPTYGRGKQGLNEHNLAWLLSEYNIRPEKDQFGKKRGYYMKQFVDAWRRELGRNEPEHLRSY